MYLTIACGIISIRFDFQFDPVKIFLYQEFLKDIILTIIKIINRNKTKQYTVFKYILMPW